MSLAALLVPTAAAGQDICTPGFVPRAETVPSCWSRAWCGRSGALDRFAAIMAMLPPDVHAQMTGAMGSDLLIAV